MTNTLTIIYDTLSQHQTGQLSLVVDTLKVYTIPSHSTGFKLAEYIKPSFDLLIALTGVFVLVWKYMTQKQKEHAERIIESKRNAYSEFLRDFTEASLNITYEKLELSNIDEDRRRINARNLLFLYGNDNVVRAYNNWVEYTDKDQVNHGSDTDVDLFGKILLEIRKDIHGKSNLTEREIRNLNPFYRG